MRIGAADERRGLEDLDSGDIVDPEAAERGDLVAGAGGDAEDAGVVVVVGGSGGEEEGEEVVAEEEGEGEDLGGPEARGLNAQGALLGGDVGARGGEVARGFGEAEVRLPGRVVGDTRVGRAEEEEEEREGGYCDGYEREALEESVDEYVFSSLRFMFSRSLHHLLLCSPPHLLHSV